MKASIAGYPQMMATEGEGDRGQNIIFFSSWKNSFQVDVDAE